MSGGRQFTLDIVDGEIAFAHGDGERADRIACGCVAWAVPDLLEEACTFAGVVAELMAEEAKR